MRETEKKRKKKENVIREETNKIEVKKKMREQKEKRIIREDTNKVKREKGTKMIKKNGI